MTGLFTLVEQKKCLKSCLHADTFTELIGIQIFASLLVILLLRRFWFFTFGLPKFDFGLPHSSPPFLCLPPSSVPIHSSLFSFCLTHKLCGFQFLSPPNYYLPSHVFLSIPPSVPSWPRYRDIPDLDLSLLQSSHSSSSKALSPAQVNYLLFDSSILSN